MANTFFSSNFFGGEFFNQPRLITADVIAPVARRRRVIRRGIAPQERREYWQKQVQLSNPAAIELIEGIAQRQVENLALDEQQRFEELERELQAKGLTWEARYLEALNARRERLMDAEIGRLLKIKLDEEEAMMLIMLAAYV